MPSKVLTWKIFDSDQDPNGVGFRGVVLDKSNNKLLPNQCRDMYNYISDGGPKKRPGNTIDNAVELTTNTGITGIFQFYDGSAYKEFAKCGAKVFDVSSIGNSKYILTDITANGDSAGQLSSWNILDGGNQNTDNGVLYWSLTNDGTTRTVNVYKNSNGENENLVATGNRSDDGIITLNGANGSGVSGSVTVAYTQDDTDLINNTLVYPSLAAGGEVQFLSWWSKYFLTDGINTYEGTTEGASALSFLDEKGNAIPGVQPHGKSILVKGERLWMTRDPNFPTRIYFSMGDSYQKFACNGGADVSAWIACDRDDGKEITGFIYYNGKIFVTKQQKSYWVLGDPNDTYPYSGSMSVVDGPTVGAYDQKTIINCPDGYLRWWGPDGVWQYSDSNGITHISDNIDEELNKISDNNKAKACAEFYDHYYVLMLPGGISEYCDGFLFDTRNGEWYPIKNWNVSCMTRFADDSLHAGFYGKGYVAQLFNGLLDNEDSEDISCYLKTKLVIPPGSGVKKYEHCLDKLQMFNIKNGQSFTLYWNANEGKASGNWSFAFDAAGVYLGEFELGDDDDPDIGDIMISEDELIDIIANPSKRMNSAQRFDDIYFEISESGPTEHSFDYLGISSYVIGEVR